jgi:hypothetical protein
MIITHDSVRFIDLPQWFLTRYQHHFRDWSKNIREIGLVHQWYLKEGYLSDLSPDPELGAQLIEVKLKCLPWSGGVEISPLEERDRALIAKHVEKMEKAGIPPDVILQEPARPGVPFMPHAEQPKAN